MASFDNDKVLRHLHMAEKVMSPDELLVLGMNIFLAATELHVEGGEGLALGPGDLEMLTEAAESFEKFLTE